MIDWDREVLAPCFDNDVFGEPATYLPANAGEPFGIDVIFDRAYTREYLMENGTSGFTSVSPTAGIRLVQFEARSIEPAKNDHVYVPRLGLTFIVRDCRPDSHGGARLFLNRVEA